MNGLLSLLPGDHGPKMGPAIRYITRIADSETQVIDALLEAMTSCFSERGRLRQRRPSQEMSPDTRNSGEMLRSGGGEALSLLPPTPRHSALSFPCHTSRLSYLGMQTHMSLMMVHVIFPRKEKCSHKKQRGAATICELIILRKMFTFFLQTLKETQKGITF